ncbi:MAG: glucose 1-dehydrogenase [Thermoleophilia bacterium]
MAHMDGKSALVTGAGSGIGRACSLVLAAAGAKVVVSDISEPGGVETVRLVRESGGEATFIRADVSLPEDVEALVAAAVSEYGALDCAVNNAGIGGDLADTVNYPKEGWDRLLAINLTGVWLCMKSEIEQMLKQGGGAVVNMASILGTVGFANATAYVAAKHGVLGITRVAALEYATRGVRVNAVCPGFILTPMLEKGLDIEAHPEVAGQIAGLHPMKRLGQPEEIAAAVVWLCSDRASFVTGHPLLVDGGYVAQ